MRGKYAILYVDDEWTNRTVFEQNFNDEFRIVTVASGAEALEAFKTDEIACLVTDQRMPEMSGNQLLERVKNLHPQTVRVVLTAYSDLDPILKAVNDGLVARYIVKPWVKGELQKILSWALEVYTLGRESSDVQLRLLKAERLITLGALVGGVLHEVKNQLAMPMSNGEYFVRTSKVFPELKILVERHGASLSDEARSDLLELCEEGPKASADIVESVRRILDILNSYKKILRENTSEPAQADPREAIRYAITLLRPNTTNVAITYDGPERLPKVAIGQTELTQLLINLGGNALQAYARASSGEIRMIAEVADTTVSFSVVDDGPGMSPEVLAQAGTPFFTTKAEGTGLGISQCRRLVAKAGGNFSLESAVGKGTTVRFTLPKSAG